MAEMITVNCDGGARGNPGPAACAYVIKRNEIVLNKASRFLGTATNNIAEYSAVVDALSWLLKNKNTFKTAQTVNFYLDSLLVVNQLNGLFKIKSDGLRNLAIQIRSLIKKLSLQIIFSGIPREKNYEADLLVNECLDQTSVSLLKLDKNPQLF